MFVGDLKNKLDSVDYLIHFEQHKKDCKRDYIGTT